MIRFLQESIETIPESVNITPKDTGSRLASRI